MQDNAMAIQSGGLKEDIDLISEELQSSKGAFSLFQREARCHDDERLRSR